VLPLLPAGLRIIRYDKRGHGLSSCPPAPYSMGALVTDAERLLDHLGVTGCVFVGLSIGGMIAQGLAVKRLDLVRGMVLSNTAAKIGTAADVGGPHRRDPRGRDRGAGGCGDGAVVLEGVPPDRGADPRLAHMLIRQPAEGYIGCAAAIAGTDFYTTTAGSRCPRSPSRGRRTDRRRPTSCGRRPS
jgi:3-oxoadipate enol-lactonase